MAELSGIWTLLVFLINSGRNRGLVYITQC